MIINVGKGHNLDYIIFAIFIAVGSYKYDLLVLLQALII